MKKIYIAMVVTIILSLIGAGVVYKLVVEEKLTVLAEAKAREEQLNKAITTMATDFSETNPQAIIKLWREKTEPWKNAALARTDYFARPESTFDNKVPEGRIPRFYYAEELPKRLDELDSYVRNQRAYISDYYFGVPGEDSFPRGTNPTAEEIEGYFKRHEFGTSLIKLLVSGGARDIETLVIWQKRSGMDGQVGKIDLLSCGVRTYIGTRELVDFLEKLRTEERYFAVEAIKILNRDLLVPDNPTLEVEFILTQTNFEERAVKVARAGGAEAAGTTEAFQSIFGGGLRRTSARQEDKPSWWKQFRRKWLPF